MPLPNRAKDDILLFFKHYDPEKEELRYSFCTYYFGFVCFYWLVQPQTMLYLFLSSSNARYAGKLFVKGNGKPTDILYKLNEMAGYAPDDEIELYEVCCGVPCLWDWLINRTYPGITPYSHFYAIMNPQSFLPF